MRDLNVHPEVVILFQIIGHHVGKMVDINNHLANSKHAQARQRDLEQRPSRNLYQSLGPGIGEWPQARAKPGGENHGFHFAGFSNSRWCTTTSTPFRPRNRAATCSAKNTDRCWPPVQPNDTIKFLKPRRWYSFTLVSTSDITLARN